MKDIEEQKKELTDLALQIGKNLGYDLDFSIESVKDVEAILSEIHKEYKKTGDEEGLAGIAVEFAAYIITVIEKNIAVGKWSRDHKDIGKDSFPYELNGETIFPYGWCIKRIFDGEGDNVWFKFKTLILILDLSEVTFPVLRFGGDESLTFARKEEEITICSKTALKNGFYKNLRIIDSIGIEYKIKDAKKVGTIGSFLSLSGKKLQVELYLASKGSIGLDDLKRQIVSIMKNDKLGLWDGDGRLDKKIAFVNNASSHSEIIKKMNDDFYRKY